jgi:hypothetical protein
MKTGQFMPEASKTTLDWLKESFLDVWDKEIWPPSSPVCKPLDYFMCGVSEFRVNAKPHNKTAYLGDGAPRQGHRGEDLQDVQA